VRAITQEGYGSIDVLHMRHMAVPQLAARRVLVEVRAASVNAMDAHGLHGAARLYAGLRRPRALVPGSDIAGIVAEVGLGVTFVQVGDEVFGTAPGAFAEYASAHQNGLVTKPANITFEEAAAIPIAGFTALQGLRDHCGVRPGHEVLINGAGGGVGTFAVQIAKALGARVTAVTGTHTVDLVRNLGADEVIDRAKQDFTRQAARYDAVLDVSADRPLRDSQRVLAPGGTLVLVGAAPGGFVAPLRRLVAGLVRRRIAKQRVVSYLAKLPRADLLVLRDMVEGGKLRPVVDRTYALAEVPQALQYAASRQANGKIVITM
jgi:NADPH:quinone reductase-like Zn-dependent oxidoreductase